MNSKLQVSDIRVRLVKNETSKILATVSMTIDECMIVHDIKVIAGKEEGTRFIAMPRRKTSDGEFKDVVHPANTETREMLQNLILQAYEEELNKPQAE